MSEKYYAVLSGRQTGIFSSWEIVKPLVSGYPGAKHKSFKTLDEAKSYLNIKETKKESTKELSIKEPTKEPTKEITKKELGKKEIKNNEDDIVVYSDGSCVDKVGGFGYVILMNDTEIPLCGKVPSYPTTNQVAELYAIYSLIYYVTNYLSTNKDKHKNCLIVYTDSQYSIGCLTLWHFNWVKNGWKNSKGESVSNKELIQAILQLSIGLKIEYRHVKAHNGNHYNEWADKLANNGRLL